MLLHLKLITLHGVMSKSQMRQKSHYKEADKHSQKNLNQAEKTQSEGIQAIVKQAAIPAVTAVMMRFRDADVGP